MKEIFAYVNARYLNGKGQGIVEYALILAFVIVVAAALTQSGGLGDAIKDIFNTVRDTLKGSSGASTPTTPGD